MQRWGTGLRPSGRTRASNLRACSAQPASAPVGPTTGSVCGRGAAAASNPGTAAGGRGVRAHERYSYPVALFMTGPPHRRRPGAAGGGDARARQDLSVSICMAGPAPLAARGCAQDLEETHARQGLSVNISQYLRGRTA
jgi:hypothetical protein